MWIAKHLYKKKLSYIGFGGNGHQIRDLIHVDDVCEIIYLQIKKIKSIYNESFNIGGGKVNSISLKELTQICRKLTGNNITIGKIQKTSKFDIPYYVSDNSKIKKFYNLKPFKNMNQIFKDVFKWLVDNKKVKKYF